MITSTTPSILKSLFRLTLFLAILLGISNLGFGQTTIVSDGLNNATTLFTLSGGAYYTGNSLSGDLPASSPLAIEGTHSRGIINGTAILTTTNNINTSTYTNVSLSLRLAAFSVGNTNGLDGGDYVTIEISNNGGASYTTMLTVTGANYNTYWAYSATGLATTVYPTTATFTPAGSGLRTTDGYSTLTITSLPAITNLKVRITLTNNSTSERWVVDDFKITGTVPCTSPSTQATIGSFTSTGNTGTTVNWTRGNGTAGVIVVGRLTSTAEVDPTSGTSYTANTAFGSGNTTGTGNYVVYKGTGTSVQVTALSAANNYTFTVYEYNTTSTCYNLAGSAAAVTTTCTPPTTQATIGNYTNNTTGTTLTANWTNGNGNGRIVVARLTSAAAVDPSSGTTYTANAAFGSGTATGTGNYVVYSGTGTTVNITGLTGNSSYTFTVYEYATTGPCYNTTGSSSAVNTPLVYCTFNYGSVDQLTSVVFAGISNTSSNTTTTAYEDFTQSVSAGQVTAGNSYTITIKGNTNGNYTDYAVVYFDWNQNGNFTDAGEYFTIGSIQNSTGVDAKTAAISISVPSTATTGNTRMRVIWHYSLYNTDPCANVGGTNANFGQVEDYKIIVAPACTAPTITSFSPTNACSGSGSAITINGANYVSGSTTVTINGVSATPVTWVSANQITVPLPVGASGTGNIVVTTCSTISSGSTFTVNALPTFTAAVNSNISCNGGSDGKINITITSANAASYTFSKNNGADYNQTFTGTFPGYTLTGLKAGKQYLRVKDVNSCESIINPEP